MKITILAAALIAATPLAAEPNAQFTNGIAIRLAPYGVDINPEALTTAQAAALHTMLVTESDRIDIRRRAEAILRNPDLRD